jgi:hypothetical protein
MFENSKFWLSTDLINEFITNKDSSQQLIILKNLKQSISNFVFILTGRYFKVNFQTKLEHPGLTNGKEIYISSDILSNEKIDCTVGIALHEASHIIYTDFSLLNDLFNNFPKSTHLIKDQFLQKKVDDFFRYVDRNKISLSKENLSEVLQIVCNVVEDRFIDNKIYTNVPGYRGYYDSIYKEFFFCKEINNILINKTKYTEENLNSYVFYLINIFNENVDLNTLIGLEEIYNLFDLENISRLKTFENRLELSFELFKLMLKYSNNKYESEGSDKNKISFDEDISDQISFTLNKFKKGKISDEKSSQINELCKQGSDVTNVSYSDVCLPIKCIFLKNVNHNTFDSFLNSSNECKIEPIIEGISKGKILIKKLRIANESNETIFNRKKSGKIDQKRIHQISCSSEDIFKIKQTDNKKVCNLHISIDGSSSMYGNKWNKTVSIVVSLCYCSKLIENLNVEVSLRQTCLNDKAALIAILFDSRKDNFKKIVTCFKHISPHGLTPEALCFDSILNEIPSCSPYEDNIFINISDGEPCFRYSTDNGYGGEIAIQHTKKQIKKFTSKNIKTLSFLISNHSSMFSNFQIMYGKKNSFLIKENDINVIANIINKKILEKR